MIVIVAIVFVVVLWYSLFVRTVVFHPFKAFYYALRDLFERYVFRLYNIYQCGRLDCYCADFGGGKTLSMADYIYHVARRYDGRKYYDLATEKWVVQRVIVLSNFTVFGVQCVPLVTLADVVEFSRHQKEYDREHGTRTCCLVCIDEASSTLNSRNFSGKDKNIDPLFLSTLITCRHYNINLIYSSQQFFLTDKLLRDVTQRVIWCNKKWRVMELFYYPAHVVENAGTIETLQPTFRTAWFITNHAFERYDTLACVENLIKDDSRLSYDEILSNLGDRAQDDDALRAHKKRKFRKAS